MARVNTQTNYDVELTDEEAQRLAAGGSVTIELPDGGSITVSPPGSTDTREGVEAGTDDDVNPEEIAQMVEEGERETTPSPQGGNTESDENPHGGGMIDIERADGGEE